MNAALRFGHRHAIALLAIFVSMGGTAFASHLVVRASDIESDAVRSKHIRQGSVKAKQANRNSLSRLFGGGVLGGAVEGLTFLPLQSGDDSRPPIGTSQSPADVWRIVAPRRMVVRDVTVDAESPPERGVNLRIRAGGDLSAVIGCVVEAGETTCHSGKERLVVKRRTAIDVWVGDTGPSDVALTENTYRFGFRITP